MEFGSFDGGEDDEDTSAGFVEIYEIFATPNGFLYGVTPFSGK